MLHALFIAAVLMPERAKELAPAPDIDVEGIYLVEGGEGEGKYAGVCVVRRAKEVFLVQWLVGATPAAGIGFRHGDTFVVGWLQELKDKSVRGVNLYAIKGKVLQGRWASLPGPGVVFRETLTFLRALPKEEE